MFLPGAEYLAVAVVVSVWFLVCLVICGIFAIVGFYAYGLLSEHTLAGKELRMGKRRSVPFFLKRTPMMRLFAVFGYLLAVYITAGPFHLLVTKLLGD